MWLDLPLDHFRLLGVSPATDAQTVLRALQLRLDRALRLARLALGERFPDMDGVDRAGLGLLDCVTVRVDRPRAVGELLTHDAAVTSPDGTVRPLGTLTGFENHAGRTTPGPSATTLGRVEIGEGNGDGSEGVVNGSVVGTYLHGPALARNPALADELLRWIVGDAALTPLDDTDVDALRADRHAAARANELAPRRSWRDRLRGS
jgi:CobQ-like glutamine amidotransferase family enzyme